MEHNHEPCIIGVGVAHNINAPKNQSLDDNEAVLVKPKQAFSLTLNAFKKLLQNFVFNGCCLTLREVPLAYCTTVHIMHSSWTYHALLCHLCGQRKV